MKTFMKATMKTHQHKMEEERRRKTGPWCPNLTVSWRQLSYKDQRREKSQRKGDLEARNQGN